MKHYVFCCINDPKYAHVVEQAIIAANNLHVKFATENDNVECKYHSDITINREDGHNTSICFENNDISQLITDCMRWAREWDKFTDYMNRNEATKI